MPGDSHREMPADLPSLEAARTLFALKWMLEVVTASDVVLEFSRASKGRNAGQTLESFNGQVDDLNVRLQVIAMTKTQFTHGALERLPNALYAMNGSLGRVDQATAGQGTGTAGLNHSA